MNFTVESHNATIGTVDGNKEIFGVIANGQYWVGINYASQAEAQNAADIFTTQVRKNFVLQIPYADLAKAN